MFPYFKDTWDTPLVFFTCIGGSPVYKSSFLILSLSFFMFEAKSQNSTFGVTSEGLEKPK